MTVCVIGEVRQSRIPRVAHRLFVRERARRRGPCQTQDFPAHFIRSCPQEPSPPLSIYIISCKLDYTELVGDRRALRLALCTARAPPHHLHSLCNDPQISSPIAAYCRHCCD
jgi:hypothetical protein